MTVSRTLRPSTPTPPPPATDHNPAAEKDPSASHVWELLRRNPFFRYRVQHLEALLDQVPPATSGSMPGVWTKETHILLRYLRLLMHINPFAAHAVQWVLRGRLLSLGMHRPLIDFFKPWPEGEWARLSIPRPQPERLRELERLIQADILGHSYNGPLKATTGSFSLNTPWPETPPLFRFNFEWLWDDFNPSSEGIGKRTFVPFLYDTLPELRMGLVTTPLDWCRVDRAAFEPLGLLEATHL